MGEELWSKYGNAESIAYEAWPVFDEALCKDDVVEIGVQVSGKVRGQIEVSDDDDEASALEKAKAVPGIARSLEGKNIIKTIYVKKKILNIVAK